MPISTPLDESGWRFIAKDDIPAWNRLLAAAEAVDHRGEHYNEDDLYEEFDNPEMVAEDRIAKPSADGDELDAFASVLTRGVTSSYVRIAAEGQTAPGARGTGLGTQSIAWILERCDERRRMEAPELPAHVEIHATLSNTGQVALLDQNEFEPVNWSATMRVALDGDLEIAEPRWPDGVRLITYDESWSGRTREAHNDAFLDHWGFSAWAPDTWDQWVDSSRNFRPQLSWVVVDDAEPETVVGYVQTNEYDANQAMTGRREAYLAKIGVRRSHRGRGVASSLLRHALREYRAAGYDESSLDVDTNNPTGAFGLYQRVGFEIESRTATYQRVLKP